MLLLHLAVVVYYSTPSTHNVTTNTHPTTATHTTTGTLRHAFIQLSYY